VLLPGFHTVTADRLRRVMAALEVGRTVVVGPRSLVRDEEAAWVDRPLPAGLTDRLGAHVDHAGSPAGWPREPADVSRVRIGDEVLDAGAWIETLAVEGEDAEVVARAEGGPLDGAPVIVRRGGLVHLGTSSREAWTAVLADVLGREPHPDHLEVVTRDDTEVVLDHRARTVTGVPGVDAGPTG
jgi:beta-galactosidase